jgi:hypothetical protein
MLIGNGDEQLFLVIEPVIFILRKTLTGGRDFNLRNHQDPGEEIVACVGNLVNFKFSILEEFVIAGLLLGA